MTCEFSVVIPAYDEEAGLGQTLSDLAAEVGDRAEIIVVDDGSTDGTFEVASGQPNVRVIRTTVWRISRGTPAPVASTINDRQRRPCLKMSAVFGVRTCYGATGLD